MPPESKQPTPDEAQNALASVREMMALGIQRGLYSRPYALAIALWGGALAATLGLSSWPVVFIAGLIIHYFWRKNADAWIKDMRSKRDVWIVLGLSTIVGVLFVGAYSAQAHYGLAWVPFVAGVLVTLLLFTIMELAYAPARAHQA